MPSSTASSTPRTASPSTARPYANHRKTPASVESLTRTTPSEPLKPSTGAAVRDHRNAVRDRSESLSAIDRNRCPHSPESAYLSAAAKAIAQDAAAQDAWMDAQKEALKTGRLDKALQALAGHIEASEADADQAPVRRCHRYLSGRRNHLNYRDALANDLPIGS